MREVNIMNNWKALAISNAKYKKIILITFFVILYLMECGPISNLFYWLEDIFEEYSKNTHISITSSLYYTFKVFDAEEFGNFFYYSIISVIYIAAPLLGIWAAYFNKKFYVYVSSAILGVLFIFTLIGKGVYEDEYEWADVTLSADTWFVLAGVALIVVLCLMDSNIISINKAQAPAYMNQSYNYNQQPYGGYNQPQMNNQYGAVNPQMNAPYMDNNAMNQGYAPNNQMGSAYGQAPQMDMYGQAYNGYDQNNGGN